MRFNCLGRRIAGGGQWERFGGLPGCSYRLALAVIGMGDQAAVDVAQASHECCLRASGCMRDGEVTRYGWSFPSSSVVEGLYIDDHFAVAKVLRRLAHLRKGRDLEIIESSHDAYERDRMGRAPEKGFGFSAPVPSGEPLPPADRRFVVVGTAVHGETGRVASPEEKRALLFRLVLAQAALPLTEVRLVQRSLALHIHPFLHRRCLLAAYHHISRWLEGLPVGQAVKWDKSMRAELVHGALLLPLAWGDTRWPVEERVSTTDATPSAGGATGAFVSRDLSEALYRSSEQKGCRTRLTGWTDPAAALLPAFPIIDDVMSAASHRVSRAGPCSARRHINLQELDEVIREVRARATPGSLGSRVTNATDSTVGLGSWGKGRSGSPGVNRQLQKAMAWHAFARVAVSNFRMSTGAIPADHPSRGAPLPAPAKAMEQWVEAAVAPAPPSRITELVGLLVHEPPVPAGIVRASELSPALRLRRCVLEPVSVRRWNGGFAAALVDRGLPQAPPCHLCLGGRPTPSPSPSVASSSRSLKSRFEPESIVASGFGVLAAPPRFLESCVGGCAYCSRRRRVPSCYRFPPAVASSASCWMGFVVLGQCTQD